MLQYTAGYKFVEGAVHAQVLDFPGAISCADNLDDARKFLASALLDAAEVGLETGALLPIPNPLACDAEMDIEEPIYLHLQVSSDVRELGAGLMAP